MDTAIAVVGVGCRFPDAASPEEFWANLDRGVLSVRELSEEELVSAGVRTDLLRAPGYVRKAATLAAPGLFAADFFGYPPTEAELIDPQQRLFLEVCWEALERAGHTPRGDRAEPRVGVFAGASHSEYTSRLRHSARAGLDYLSLQLGGGADFIAARVAHKLGLRGPSVAVQTACSSSLTAVHYAVLSLLSGECDLALAGGAGVAEPATGYEFQPGGILSDDGYCRAFDARSSGTTVGSGVGVVALRRLADAIADRDEVLAVVCGSAVGNDGSDRPGFTAPTPNGPADVVSAALHTAGVGADSLCYLEAHGSGTQLGDHVELRGLTDGLRAFTARKGFCALGSVKANIGHTGAAAGIAGLIKAVHVARTGSLPPHPLFERPRDPGLLADSPFHVPTIIGTAADPDRHVLVNSMGLGGTNAVVVLSAGPAPVARPATHPEVIRLHLSARNRTELDAMSAQLADELDRRAPRPEDVAFTLRVGRRDFAERRVVTARPDRLAALLRLPRPRAVRTERPPARRPVVVARDRDDPVVTTLLAALGWQAEVVDTPPDPVPDDVVLLAATDPLDEALSTAWLHGVRVDWSALGAEAHRVPLPTYPFSRKRFWALDHLDVPPSSPAPVADGLEGQLLGLWRELFGVDTIGIDDEFGALGGTSLLSVRMAIEVQQRHGVLVNLHRVGGSRATVRRIAAAMSIVDDTAVDGDGALVDEDLAADLGPVATFAAPGTDVLLTGATGFVGAFLLRELIDQTPHRIHCLVRAETEDEGWRRLRAAAASFRLPSPDPARVSVVPGDLRDIGAVLRGSALAGRVGHVVHCAARVVFSEPYRVLRADNVLSCVDLLKWMRGNGIGEFSFVSSLAATGPAVGMGEVLPERRDQPLDPHAGGYGASKWVGERLLDRAERDGMRVRVFRPGLISGATDTGACNTRDMVWRMLAAGIAVGTHPLDDRPMPIAPVDLVARAIVGLSFGDGESAGSVGRAYHLVDQDAPTLPRLFGLLDVPTRGVPVVEWLDQVAKHAVETGDPVLASMALYNPDDRETDWGTVECGQWQGWLRRHGLSAAPAGDRLRRCVRYLAEQPDFSNLLKGQR